MVIYKFNKLVFLKREESARKLSPCATKVERRHLVQAELERDLENRSENHEKYHLYEVYYIGGVSCSFHRDKKLRKVDHLTRSRESVKFAGPTI